jgi:hypothetical protein
VKKSERPLVSACVIGRDGDVIVTIFEEKCLLQVRNPEQERHAIVELGYEQAMVVRDIFDQMAPGLDDDE